MAKHAFTKADDLARWRVVRMLRTRHRWGWKDVRRRLTGPTGRWRPITAGGIELRKISKISVTRYRYRGNTIPSPPGTANT